MNVLGVIFMIGEELRVFPLRIIEIFVGSCIGVIAQPLIVLVVCLLSLLIYDT